MTTGKLADESLGNFTFKKIKEEREREYLQHAERKTNVRA